ncbi:MAG TPA: hypothetical protein HA283_04750 [Nanoarchaeota archaeon]|nr:hypothetical protein [Nanoarchaeota archaeon]HIH63577.1 hypothetical protein [Nanoarchaeota archaeon]HIJ10168.1 hypothetical protein [Nanoarchaeota archaeon]HLD55405.1 hypothetical protein [Candidatus Nanoarchaeia archaeon]
MANQQINMPAGFGGLTRFNEEYGSYISLSPSHVVLFIILVVAFRFFLGVFL